MYKNYNDAGTKFSDLWSRWLDFQPSASNGQKIIAGAYYNAILGSDAPAVYGKIDSSYTKLAGCSNSLYNDQTPFGALMYFNSTPPDYPSCVGACNTIIETTIPSALNDIGSGAGFADGSWTDLWEDINSFEEFLDIIGA